MDDAQEMASIICEASPLAVRYVKEIMTRARDLPIEEALRFEEDFQTVPHCRPVKHRIMSVGYET
jgi:enoyl-CoA hydratase/carnithine racemase